MSLSRNKAGLNKALQNQMIMLVNCGHKKIQDWPQTDVPIGNNGKKRKSVCSLKEKYICRVGKHEIYPRDSCVTNSEKALIHGQEQLKICNRPMHFSSPEPSSQLIKVFSFFVTEQSALDISGACLLHSTDVFPTKTLTCFLIFDYFIYLSQRAPFSCSS